MAIGFESFVEGTTDAQINRDDTFFILAYKGTAVFTRNVSVSLLGTSQRYYEIEATLTHNVDIKHNPIVAAVQNKDGMSFAYATIGNNHKQTNLRIISYYPMTAADLTFLVFSTQPPVSNPSRMGLELYSDAGILCFASESLFLTPVGQLSFSGNQTSFIGTTGRQYAILMNKTLVQRDKDGEYEAIRYDAVGNNGNAFTIESIGADTTNAQGSDFYHYYSNFMSIYIIDVTGY